MHVVLIAMSVVFLSSSYYNIYVVELEEYHIMGYAELLFFVVAVIAYISTKWFHYHQFASWVTMIITGSTILLVIYATHGREDSYIFITLFALTTYLLLGHKQGLILYGLFTVAVSYLSLSGYSQSLSSVYNIHLTLILSVVFAHYYEKAQAVAIISVEEEKDQFQKQVEEKVAELRQKDQLLLEQSKLASMGEMLGSIAHQWRQPLNVLSINIQNLMYEYEDGKIDETFLEEFIEKNKATILYMSTTIDDFRNFFITTKEVQNFDIVAAINASINLLDAQLKSHHIQCNFNYDNNESYTVLGFPNEFKQVIINIIANAKDVIVFKRLESGVLEISVTKNAQSIFVTISDNAHGIPEEIIDRVFEPYFTTKFESQGTGLGLYMSKTIIEKNMLGQLSVKNLADGAEFTIELPLKGELS
jgi:signal transduction histidine kinase